MRLLINSELLRLNLSGIDARLNFYRPESWNGCQEENEQKNSKKENY